MNFKIIVLVLALAVSLSSVLAMPPIEDDINDDDHLQPGEDENPPVLIDLIADMLKTVKHYKRAKADQFLDFIEVK